MRYLKFIQFEALLWNECEDNRFSEMVRIFNAFKQFFFIKYLMRAFI